MRRSGDGLGVRLEGAVRKGCLGLLLFFVVCFLMGLGWLIYGWVRSGREAARFEPLTAEFQAACAECFAGATAVPDQVVRRGRVLIVSADTGKAVGITVNLMDEARRARNPDELGTVVCVTPPEKAQVGNYSDGSMAYRESREACALTWPERVPLFARHVTGPEPPAVKAGASGDQTGGDPVTSPLMYWLEEAPEG
jgi:hypothetical protein